MAVDSPCGNIIVSSSPGILVAGGPIEDSTGGKTCHQCRQKNKNLVAACKNQRNKKPCAIKICQKCLLNRYGEKAEEVAVLEWSCPRCRGICNCSVCMKRRGHQPTGILINTAKANGFSSVSEMLVKGAESVNHEKVGAAIIDSPKEGIVISPRKRGKENSFDGKIDANLPNSVEKSSKKVKEVRNGFDDNIPSKIINQGHKRERKEEGFDDIHDSNGNAVVLTNKTGVLFCEKKSKKIKCDRAGERGNDNLDGGNLNETTAKCDEKKKNKSTREALEENGNSNLEGTTLARCSSPKKLKVSNKLSNKGGKLNSRVGLKESMKNRQVVSKKNFAQIPEDDSRKENVDIPLPVGTELTSVAGIDVSSEDVGNALQFLEFCSVFRKILGVRKGQPEQVLQDLLHGRTSRRGKFSLTVQFHIHLISAIQNGHGQRWAELSPTCGKSSWFQMLKKCLSKSQSILKAQGLDSLEKATDYENFDASEKLRVLNILCDEIVGTEKIRNWIDDQNMKLSEKVKEAKQKVHAAKLEEKSLKQKRKNDIATNASIPKDGDSLPISDQAETNHDKPGEVQAHANMVGFEDILLRGKQTPDAVRIDPAFLDSRGHAYWKLNSIDNSEVLDQNIGKGDALTLGEKWVALDAQGKEVIEKHVSLLGQNCRPSRASRGSSCALQSVALASD